MDVTGTYPRTLDVNKVGIHANDLILHMSNRQG